MAKSKLIVSRKKKSTVLVSVRTLEDAIVRANAIVDSMMDTNPNDPTINRIEGAVQHMSRILNANPQQMKQDGVASIADYMDSAKSPAIATKLKQEVDMISKMQSQQRPAAPAQEVNQGVGYVPDSAVYAASKSADGGAAFTTDRNESGEAKAPELIAVPRLA